MLLAYSRSIQITSMAYWDLYYLILKNVLNTIVTQIPVSICYSSYNKMLSVASIYLHFILFFSSFYSN